MYHDDLRFWWRTQNDPNKTGLAPCWQYPEFNFVFLFSLIFFGHFFLILEFGFLNGNRPGKRSKSKKQSTSRGFAARFRHSNRHMAEKASEAQGKQRNQCCRLKLLHTSACCIHMRQIALIYVCQILSANIISHIQHVPKSNIKTSKNIKIQYPNHVLHDIACV